QRGLARDVTTRVHGEGAIAAAEEVTALLFGGSEPSSLSVAGVEALRGEIPFYSAASLGDPQAVIDAVTGDADALFKSKGDAKRMVQQGGVYLNGLRVDAATKTVTPLHGRYVLVRKGAKNYALVGKS